MLTWDEVVGSLIYFRQRRRQKFPSYESSVTVRSTKEEIVISLITNGDTTADSMLHKSICFCISSSNFFVFVFLFVYF